MGSGTPCKDQMQVECLLKEVYDRLSMLATWFWPDVSSGIDLFLRILAVADDGNTRHQGKTRSMSNNVLGCCLAALCSQLEDCSRDSNPDMQGYPLNDTLTSPPNAPCRFLKGCINTALSLSLFLSLPAMGDWFGSPRLQAHPMPLRAQGSEERENCEAVGYGHNVYNTTSLFLSRSRCCCDPPTFC